MVEENSLQGAKFTITNPEKNYAYETIIDEKLVLTNIPTGVCTYSISKEGYKTFTNTFNIEDNQHFTFPVELEKETGNSNSND